MTTAQALEKSFLLPELVLLPVAPVGRGEVVLVLLVLKEELVDRKLLLLLIGRGELVVVGVRGKVVVVVVSSGEMVETGGFDELILMSSVSVGSGKPVSVGSGRSVSVEVGSSGSVELSCLRCTSRISDQNLLTT
jgi:hypothetical protein